MVHSLELSIEADVVTSPMWAPLGQEPRPVGFEAIRVEVRMGATASSEALRALTQYAVLWSRVTDPGRSYAGRRAPTGGAGGPSSPYSSVRRQLPGTLKAR